MVYSLVAGVKRLWRNRFIKFGLPFIVLVVGGSFGLKEFAQLRYQFRKSQMISNEEAEKMGIKMKKSGQVTLESEYEKIRELDVDNWTNKRGPRPWESTPEAPVR